MIAGLESVDSGEIEIGNSIVTNKLPKFRNISMVFQSYALYPHITVSENIAFPLKVRGISGDVRDRAILDAAKQVHMEDLLDRYPRQLSGGQRQRVALARAIVRQPDIFLMDEPLSSLDAKLRESLRVELKKIQLNLGSTILYVTHDQAEATTMADRIGVLENGKIAQIDKPEDIGQFPDGVEGDLLADKISSANVLSFKDILSNSIFWILTIIFTLQLSANLGVYTHIPIFSQDLGYSPFQASWIYSVAAFHAAMGKIVFGRLLDNLGARRTILISLFFHGLGIGILIFATNLVMLLLAVMVMGLGLGGTIPLMNSTFAIAFGNANFGKARGLVAVSYTHLTLPTKRIV